MLFHLDEEGAIDFKDNRNIKRENIQMFLNIVTKSFYGGIIREKILQIHVF